MIWKALVGGLAGKEGEAFAKQLAAELVAQLGDASERSNRKFQARAGKALAQAERRVAAFKTEHKPSWLQRSKCGNTFLWALEDAGCPESYAQELTQWFVTQLG
jgi:hypothetical protein